jgi:hypothetical protein
MIETLIYIIVLCVVVGVAWWIFDYLPVPEPLNKIGKVVVMIVALIILVYLLLGLVGRAPDLRLP